MTSQQNAPQNNEQDQSEKQNPLNLQNEELVALRDHIVFQFEQDGLRVNSGGNVSDAFQEKTNWGFEFFDYNESTNHPRWGTVVVVGPEVKEHIVPGMRVLIDALRWTNHVVYKNQKYWRTDETNLLAYDADSIPDKN